MLDFPDANLGSMPDSLFTSYRRSGSARTGQAASSASLASVVQVNGVSAEHANPEADSYMYMETLLEALATLGRLDSALETVAQRVPSEIHALVETTLDEVDER